MHGDRVRGERNASLRLDSVGSGWSLTHESRASEVPFDFVTFITGSVPRLDFATTRTHAHTQNLETANKKLLVSENGGRRHFGSKLGKNDFAVPSGLQHSCQLAFSATLPDLLNIPAWNSVPGGKKIQQLHRRTSSYSGPASQEVLGFTLDQKRKKKTIRNIFFLKCGEIQSLQNPQTPPTNRPK